MSDDEVLNEGDEGTIDPMDLIKERRGPGRPKKVQAAAPDSPAPEPPVLATELPDTDAPMPELPAEEDIPVGDAMSSAERRMVMTVMEKILDRLDADPHNAQALQMFERVMEMHGEVLRQTSPMKENKRHPDISAYNPKGERDFPRPQLRRPVYFLGVPLEQQTLTWEEIDVLNSIEASMESPDHQWKATILRTPAGGEILYVQVPFTGFDDLRGVKLLPVLRGILGGTQPESNDVLDRIAALLQANEAMSQRLAALEAQQANTISVP